MKQKFQNLHYFSKMFHQEMQQKIHSKLTINNKIMFIVKMYSYT